MLPGADIVAHCAAKSSVAVFANWLRDEDTQVVLAEHGVTGAPVGYTVLTTPDLPIPALPGDWELKRIYTLSLTHGSGLGAALIARAITDGAARGRKRMLLGVHPENRRARRFYERAGFEVIGERSFAVGASVILDPIYARDL